MGVLHASFCGDVAARASGLHGDVTVLTDFVSAGEGCWRGLPLRGESFSVRGERTLERCCCSRGGCACSLRMLPRARLYT